jgi:hypothetical protein
MEKLPIRLAKIFDGSGENFRFQRNEGVIS